jgi:hypothetical protein
MPGLTVEIDHRLVVRLRPLAARRDVPIRRLVTDLLDAVGEAPALVVAILDDDGDLGG